MKSLEISVENAEYQVIESLKNNRTKRMKHREVFIEGIESIKQSMEAKKEISRIITTRDRPLSDWAKGLVERSKGATFIRMSDPLYRRLCDKEEPSELVVTVKMDVVEFPHVRLGARPFVLIFDRPSDYGNFGSLIRSANSFQVDAIFVVGHGVDIHDPRVIRSSLGSVFHSQITQVPSMEQLSDWVRTQKAKTGLQVVGTDSTGPVPLPCTRLETPIALVIGNEATGMSVALKDLCDVVTRIPISGNVNSLNVSCAASIFLWEIYRNSMVSSPAN